MIRVILEQSIHAAKVSVDFDMLVFDLPFFQHRIFNGPRGDARKPDCYMQSAKTQTSLISPESDQPLCYSLYGKSNS